MMSRNRQSRTFVFATTMVVLTCLGGARRSALAREPEHADLLQTIRTSVAAGTDWLRRTQRRDGTWGAAPPGHSHAGDGRAPAGSADAAEGVLLATWALQKSGMAALQRPVKAGMLYLKRRMTAGPLTDRTALDLLLLTALDARKPVDIVRNPNVKRRGVIPSAIPVKRWVEQAVERVEGSAIPIASGARAGITPRTRAFLSALALNAVQRHRLFSTPGGKNGPIPWDEIRTATLKRQDASGSTLTFVDPRDSKRCAATARGFSFAAEGAVPGARPPASVGGTACGLTILSLAESLLIRIQPGDKQVQARAAATARALDDGLAWLVSRWSAFVAQPQTPTFVQDLYTVARTLEILRANTLGERSWPEEAVPRLLSLQASNGAWKRDGATSEDELRDTCYALLVLQSARNALKSARGGR